MAARYDLLVLDLDGTLLDRSGAVSARNAGAIRQARDAGLMVIVATGRALVECAHVLETIELHDEVIVAGGAMLTDATSGRTVVRRAVPADLVVQVGTALQAHGHLVHVLKDPEATGYDYLVAGRGELDEASRWWFSTLPVRIRFVETVEDDPDPADSVRVGTVACGQELATVTSELRDAVGDRAFLQHWPAVTESEATGAKTHLLEVFSPRVDKWTMIEAVCERGGLDPARVATIGDGLNDVTMVRHAGLGIAMGNADPGVMHVADQVTADHESDGVADAIREILAGSW